MAGSTSVATARSRGGADDDGGSTDDGTTDGEGALVRTAPASIDLSAGSTTTMEIVATEISGGVGAGNVTATVADPSVATIDAVEVTGDPGIGGGEIRDDGASMVAEFALRDGANDPPVRIVQLTVRGVAEGSTTLALSVSSLGDEQGNSYAVASTPDSRIDVGAAGDDTTGDEAGTDPTETVGRGNNAGGETTDSNDANGATDGGAGTDTLSAGGGEPTAGGSTGSEQSGTGSSPVPADPSVALPASAVIVVFLPGLLVVAAS